MSWRFNAQSLGSILVVGAFAVSEATAHYLSAHPASALAWYVSLEVFRPFELARAGTSPLRILFGPASLAVSLAILGAIVVLHLRRHRWGVALAANLSFLFAAFLAGSWSGGGATTSAALGGFAGTPSGDGVLVAAMLGVSFLSVAVSHLVFLGRVAADLGRSDASVT